MAHPPHTGLECIVSSSSPASREVFALFSLAGRVAVITGASRGIGLEVATAYAEAGAVVYCLDTESEPSEELKKAETWLNTLPDLPQELREGVRFE